MENIFKVKLDGFTLLVEIYNEYKSLDFEITGIYEGDLSQPLDNEYYEMIMEDFEEEIIEEIYEQIQALKEGF